MNEIRDALLKEMDQASNVMEYLLFSKFIRTSEARTTEELTDDVKNGLTVILRLVGLDSGKRINSTLRAVVTKYLPI